MKKMKRMLTFLCCLALALTLLPLSALGEKTVTILCQSERRADHPLSRIDEYTCYQVFKEWLAEKGIVLSFDLIAPEQYDNTVDMRLAAQLDLPDIISLGWNYDDTKAIQLAQNGTLLNILEACEKYDEDGSIWKYIDEKVPETRGLTTAPDGGIYWFVYPYSASFYHLDGEGKPVQYEDCKGVSYGININKDWLDACGMDYTMFMTPEEFKAALITFREKDANGDGAANEILDIDITNFDHGIAAAFGLYGISSFTDASDQVQCAWYSENIVPFLNYMHELYELGVYDTKCLSEGMIDQVCAAGEASAFSGYHGWSSTYDFTKDKYLYAPIILDDDQGADGFNLPRRDSTSSTYMKFGVTSACTDLQAVIDVMDKVYTDEYAVLSYYGTEKTYGVDENGFLFRNYDTAKLNDPEWLDLPAMYTFSMNALPAVNNAKFLLETYTPFPAWDEFFALEDYIFANDSKSVNEPNLTPLALPTAEEAATVSSLQNVLETYSKELLIDMILGNKKIEDLDQYLSEMKTLGLDEYLAVFQARHDRYVEAMK